MKTRSAPEEAPNIAAIVKARHHARFVPIGTTNVIGNASGFSSGPLQDVTEPGCVGTMQLPPGMTAAIPEDQRASTEEKNHKGRPDGTPRLLRATWSPDDRRLFFQAVRLYGRNFNEITRYIRSRGHRNAVDSHSSVCVSNSTFEHTNTQVNEKSHSLSNCPITSSICSASGNVTSNLPISNCSGTQGSVGQTTSDLNAQFGGRTREQVRFFYQQTWHKIKRYVKFPDEVPQHAREVYAIINYSVLRARIKKPLDNRLGEKLNELVYCGTTVVKHNGRRFLLRTPVCQALKQLNNISAPTHEFLLPEDVWIELVPRTQSDCWRVIEAEQNPRLRLLVDINRQLSDLVTLAESKWQLASERMQRLLNLPPVREYTSPHLLLRLCPTQMIDGAIRLHEVARFRPGDMALRAYLERANNKLQPTVSVPRARLTSESNSSNPTGELFDTTSIAVTATTTNSLVNQITNSSDPSPLTISPSHPVVSIPAITPTIINTTNTTTSTTTTTTTTTAPLSIESGIVQSESQTQLHTNSSNTTAELDLRELGKQLSIGVDREAARVIKILAIYLALGCPERIRFEYQFVCPRSVMNSDLVSPYDGFLTYQPDPDGDGISNGLRRLLHLNASDYLLHRDWLSRAPSVTRTPTTLQPPRPIAPSTTTTAAAAAATTTPSINIRPQTSRSVTTNASIVTSTGTPQIPLNAGTVVYVNPSSFAISAQRSDGMSSTLPQLLPSGAPALAPYPSVVLQATPATSVTVLNSASKAIVTTPNSTSHPMSTSVEPNTQPKIVLLPQTVGQKSQVPIVERQLVHEMPPITPRPNLAPNIVRQITPSPILPKLQIAPMSQVGPPAHPNVLKSDSINSNPKKSSISSVKAFNARRRYRATEPSRMSSTAVKSQTLSIIKPHTASTPLVLLAPCSLSESSNPPVTINLNVSSASLAVKNSVAATNISHESVTTTTMKPSNSVVLLNASRSSPLWPQSVVSLASLPRIQNICTVNVTQSSMAPSNNPRNFLPYVSVSTDEQSQDISMEALLDASATNQSSLSAMSNDTLASLLNTICPQFTTSSQSVVNDQPINTQSRDAYCPTKQTSFMTQSSGENGDPSPVSNDFTSNRLTPCCKLEDSSPINPQSFEDNTRGTFSTPQFSQDSPYNGDYSFTDSMAAAVLDTNHDYPQTTDQNPLNSVAVTERESESNVTSRLLTCMNTSSNMMDYESTLPPNLNYSVNVEAFLRMLSSYTNSSTEANSDMSLPPSSQ